MPGKGKINIPLNNNKSIQGIEIKAVLKMELGKLKYAHSLYFNNFSSDININ